MSSLSMTLSRFDSQRMRVVLKQDTEFAAAYKENYGHVRQIRPGGSTSNVIVFGDFGSPHSNNIDANVVSLFVYETFLC